VTDPKRLIKDLGLLDSTMIVAGSMIGSGIFIVSADMARQLGSPGWLILAWIFTGALTLAAALSYGELASMMPKAGGQYVYLREAYSPMWGFLYGWALFLVIQTGTIAAVAVAFARFLGVLAPNWVSEDLFLFNLGTLGRWSLSLSSAQVVAVAVILSLTAINLKGIHQGKLIQNTFTITKTGALLGLILLGLLLGRRPEGALHQPGFWTPLTQQGITLTGLAFVMALGTAMVGSLFSSDAWNNVTFTAGEARNPRRDVPLSLAIGVGLVTLLYVLANVAYLAALPLSAIQNAPADRVATAAMKVIFGDSATVIMAVAIMISTFGCANGLILAGARVYYAMALDGLFFKRTASLNRHGAPGWGLALQAAWASLLILRPGPEELRKPLQQPARLRDLHRDALLRAHGHRPVRAASEAAGGGAAVSRVRLSHHPSSLHHSGGGDRAGPACRREDPTEYDTGTDYRAHGTSRLLPLAEENSCDRRSGRRRFRSSSLTAVKSWMTRPGRYRLSSLGL
jgi:APA family basic amino acid/polyamine antiporter